MKDYKTRYLSFVLMFIPALSFAEKSLGDKYLYCSAYSYVMSSPESNGKEFGGMMGKRSGMFNDLAGLYFSLKEGRMTNGDISRKREPNFNMLQNKHVSGKMNQLIYEFTLCAYWGDFIEHSMTTDIGKDFNNAIKNSEALTLLRIFEYALAEPSKNDVDEYSKDFEGRDQLVGAAFTHWKKQDYITPIKFREKLRSEIMKR